MITDESRRYKQIITYAMKPIRLQLSRRRGFNLQANSLALNGLPAVNVARPSRFGNPHRVGFCPICGVKHTQAEAVAEFEAMLKELVIDWTPMLRGKNLACFCKLDGSPCHADIILREANK